MKIGVNLTSPGDLPLVLDLLKSGHADFCEILIDNFFHLDPADVRAGLGDYPIAFHIMQSRFLERSPSELQVWARRIKVLITEVQPFYVSDHIAQFTDDGRNLPTLMEVDYRSETKKILDGISVWQDALGVRLSLENFPSILDSGNEQTEFFLKMVKCTGANVLFDFSNAQVAEYNCGTLAREWRHLLPFAPHWHVGGYRFSDQKPFVAIDSHDGPISDESLHLLSNLPSLIDNSSGQSIVVERDAHKDFQSWAEDLRRVRQVVG